MHVYDLLQEKIQYNQWANSSMVDWLREQSADLYTQEVLSSFPSLNKVLHHMVDAETYYLSILTGQEAAYKDELSTDTLFTQLLSVDEQLLTWFLNQDSTSVDKEISLKRSPFVETYTVATLITHLINHSTYHRGQVVAMRHQLGIPAPPKLDYYRYFIALQLSKKP